MRRPALAAGLASCAAGLAWAPAYADLLPSTPLPTLTPVQAPTVSPLPLQSPLSGVVGVISPTPSPSPTATAVGGGGGGGGTGGGVQQSSTGAGPGGGQSLGGGGASGGATGGGGGTHSSAGDPSTGGPGGGLPVLSGLRSGAQEVAWLLVALLPLMLLVWIVTLLRAAGRLRVLRSSATVIAAAADLGLSPREIVGLSPTALERLRDQLAVDELTGCMRRASGVAALDREIARARREREPLAVAFVDADGLKHANDTLGHAAGDQLLRDVARGLLSRLRGSDFVFRYGGDEFVCVLPGASMAGAAEVLSDVQIQLRASGRSFSLGIAELLAEDTSLTLLGRADEALYAAKRALKAGREPSTPVRVLPDERVSSGS